MRYHFYVTGSPISSNNGREVIECESDGDAKEQADYTAEVGKARVIVFCASGEKYGKALYHVDRREKEARP